jgi:hypothetical protein
MTPAPMSFRDIVLPQPCSRDPCIPSLPSWGPPFFPCPRELRTASVQSLALWLLLTSNLPVGTAHGKVEPGRISQRGWSLPWTRSYQEPGPGTGLAHRGRDQGKAPSHGLCPELCYEMQLAPAGPLDTPSATKRGRGDVLPTAAFPGPPSSGSLKPGSSWLPTTMATPGAGHQIPLERVCKPPTPWPSESTGPSATLPQV